MNTIGLKRGTVKIVAYNPDWVAAFEAEKNNLERVIGEYVSAIEHVGSTAVPKLAAKPIIDMIAAVDDLSIYTQLLETLTEHGYEYMPERVFADRVFFPKGPRENRTHHLSLVIKNSKGWTEPIAFRDYLRCHPIERKKYQALKEKLAEQYPNHRALYTQSKDTLIKEMLAKATAGRSN